MQQCFCAMWGTGFEFIMLSRSKVHGSWVGVDPASVKHLSHVSVQSRTFAVWCRPFSACVCVLSLHAGGHQPITTTDLGEGKPIVRTHEQLPGVSWQVREKLTEAVRRFGYRTEVRNTCVSCADV